MSRTMQDQVTRMRILAERHADGPRHQTILPRVLVHRGEVARRPTHGLYEPSLVLVLQGAKQVTVGDRILRYDASNYFVTSVAVPVASWVIEGTPAQPYLAFTLQLDRVALCSLILDMPPADEGPAAGFTVGAVTPGLLDALSRLLSLLETPVDVPVLAPLHEREVLYRLLAGPYGGSLRQIARADSQLSRISLAIAWIRRHFHETLRVEQLALHAGMSPPTFHRHFKAVTAMSPLQYQKMLRLQEARRLLGASPDVASAGHQVGYESASQFSREYARMFGAPPGRDTERLRGRDAGVAASPA